MVKREVKLKKSCLDFGGHYRSDEERNALKEKYFQKSTHKLLPLIVPILINDRRYEEIGNAIDWFERDFDKVLKEVSNKIDTNEWFKARAPEREMSALREKFTELKSRDIEGQNQYIEENRIKYPTLSEKFDDKDNEKKLTELLVREQIADLKSLEQEGKDLKIMREKMIDGLSYPIVWEVPGRKMINGQEVDNFKYGSRKPEKEVYKPYTEIHHFLLDPINNWITGQVLAIDGVLSRVRPKMKS